MLPDYFAIGQAIETMLREKFSHQIKMICSPFTVNNPNELKNQTVSLHLAQLPSTFGNYTGGGSKQTEVQKWQISLCYKSPTTHAEEQLMRETVGRLWLDIRQSVQGFSVLGVGGKTLRVTQNQNYMTEDCRFRIFSFTAETECVI